MLVPIALGDAGLDVPFALGIANRYLVFKRETVDRTWVDAGAVTPIEAHMRVSLWRTPPHSDGTWR
jgi:hypothetical protein